MIKKNFQRVGYHMLLLSDKRAKNMKRTKEIMINEKWVTCKGMESDGTRRINGISTFAKSFFSSCFHLREFDFLPSLFGIDE